jgi:hypothetical protein
MLGIDIKILHFTRNPLNIPGSSISSCYRAAAKAEKAC